MRSPNWIQQADQAMQRAALRARAVAASTNTPIHMDTHYHELQRAVGRLEGKTGRLELELGALRQTLAIQSASCLLQMPGRLIEVVLGWVHGVLFLWVSVLGETLGRFFVIPFQREATQGFLA